jgi:hypothetical protein
MEHLLSPGVDVPWVASDGTCWLYFAQFSEWTGWQPGEPGVWSRTIAEFRASYPEAPPEGRRISLLRRIP